MVLRVTLQLKCSYRLYEDSERSSDLKKSHFTIQKCDFLTLLNRLVYSFRVAWSTGWLESQQVSKMGKNCMFGANNFVSVKWCRFNVGIYGAVTCFGYFHTNKGFLFQCANNPHCGVFVTKCYCSKVLYMKLF